MLLRLLVPSLLVVLLAASVHGADYGADCSFPVHSKDLRCGDLLGDRKSFYEEYMEGCRQAFGKKAYRCDETEQDRLTMSFNQPGGMVNFTSTGFMKIQAPKELRKLLADYWEKNQHKKKDESWGVGNIYTNNWASPTYMVSVEDTKLRGGGQLLKRAVWDAAKSTIEQWTGMEQEPSSMYGIRMYTEGAVLSPHVDRLPLVSSCIVNVAQDVDEPWPLEVYDRQGNAVNVTMEPGDMVLYESGSLIHGRPFPLKGRYFANIFIHFEPTGRPLTDHSDDWKDQLDPFYPPYILQDTQGAEDWAHKHPHGWKKKSPSAPAQQVNSPEGHFAAATGDVDRLHKLVAENKKALKFKDENGWQPIHEAARAGHKEVVELLVDAGVDVNARTGKTGNGPSPLTLALDYHGKDHPVVQYLMNLGAEAHEYEEL